MTNEVYTDSEGNRYNCDELSRRGDQLIHSRMCILFAKSQCPHYHKCHRFTIQVNLVNSHKYKFQSMISRIQRENKPLLEKVVPNLVKIVSVTKEEIEINLAIESLFNNQLEVPRNVDHKRILAKKRSIAREQRRAENIRKRFMVNKAYGIFKGKEKLMKAWLAEQGITYITQAEKDILKRIKKRKERGIILDGEKVYRGRRKRSQKELAKYRNASKVTFDVNDDDEELIFTIKSVDRKQEPTKDRT